MAATAIQMLRPGRTLTEVDCALRWEYPRSNSAAFTSVFKSFVFPSRRSSARIVVTADQLPDWVAPTIDGFLSIQALDENWDTYGSRRISEDVMRQALSILTQIMSLSSPVPSVVPMSDGGLQIEWHKNRRDLEVAFSIDASPTYSYLNRATGQSKEGFATDVLALAMLIGEIA